MKKGKIALIVIGSILVVAGIAVGTIGYWQAGGFEDWTNINRFSGYIDETKDFTETETNTVTRIEVYNAVGDINVTHSEDSKIHIKYKTDEYSNYQIGISDGALKIKSEYKFDLWKNLWYWPNSSQTLEIAIPPTLVFDLDVESDIGSIEIVKTFLGNIDKKITADTNTGSIHIANQVVKSIDSETNTGSITIENCQSHLADSVLKNETDTGSIKYKGNIAFSKITDSTSVGSIGRLTETHTLDVLNYTGATSTGSINLKIASRTDGDYKFKSSTGGINLELSGIDSDYNISYKTSVGSKLHGASVGNTSGSRTVDIRLSTGSGKISFF